MRILFLSLVLLTMQVCGIDKTEETSSSGRKFLTATKSIALDLGLSGPLNTIENWLSSILPGSYRYSNILSRVVFNAGVLAPELQKNSDIVSAQLSIKDLSILGDHLSRIQDCVVMVANNQGLELHVPLLARVDEHPLLNYPLLTVLENKAAKVVNAFFGREIERDLKEETLRCMLKGFQRIAPLASIIKVDKFKSRDLAYLEEVNVSLNELYPILKKASGYTTQV